MRGPLDTIRARILIGLVLLMAGLVATAIGGAMTLRRVRRATADELAALRTSSEIGSGLVTSVLEEIRAAEQYLAAPAADVRRQFDASADEAFEYERRLAALSGLAVEDRLAINRLRQLHATIQTEYAIAHALTDLGREPEALAHVRAIRPQAAELTRLVRDLSRRQADQAARAGERLAADSIDRERKLLVIVVALLLVGFFLSRYTLQSVQGPLGRLVTAAERFGSGDLRPVTTGDMPREFRVLAEAMQRMGDRLRHIVGDVIGESDRIAGSAGDLSAVSEQLAASSSQVSSAMVEISSGADEQRAALGSMGTGIEELRKATADMAEAADRAAQLGEEIRTVAERHRGDVAAAGSALLDVREVVQTTSQQVAQLAELSASIDDFVELIKRISSQTNLLALNAAIEAARAGEHGKGFAVVAEEVRQLADESARAAEAVTRTTALIREQMEDVTATMTVGQAKVRGIESVADGAARGLGEIAAAVELVEQAAARVRIAAQANRETTARLQQTAEQVGGRATAHAASAQQVTAAAQQQGASTQEMAAAAGGLLQAAEKLRGLVRGFRV
jgi:methyl-accepting chemotaxis protein